MLGTRDRRGVVEWLLDMWRRECDERLAEGKDRIGIYDIWKPDPSLISRRGEYNTIIIVEYVAATQAIVCPGFSCI